MAFLKPVLLLSAAVAGLVGVGRLMPASQDASWRTAAQSAPTSGTTEASAPAKVSVTPAAKPPADASKVEAAKRERTAPERLARKDEEPAVETTGSVAAAAEPPAKVAEAPEAAKTRPGMAAPARPVLTMDDDEAAPETKQAKAAPQRKPAEPERVAEPVKKPEPPVRAAVEEEPSPRAPAAERREPEPRPQAVARAKPAPRPQREAAPSQVRTRVAAAPARTIRRGRVAQRPQRGGEERFAEVSGRPLDRTGGYLEAYRLVTIREVGPYGTRVSTIPVRTGYVPRYAGQGGEPLAPSYGRVIGY